MGALHEGHLSLVDAARQDCDFIVATIFVNPTQFGPGEDFSKYPRTLAKDVELLSPRGVDLVFAPEASAIYGPEHVTKVILSGPALSLEGDFRPTHFEGVATIVLKLFNLVQPDRAYFGRKDFQQAMVVQRMVADLDVPVEVIVCPTVREPDGLAMSSRNVYLSPEERQRALSLSQALSLAKQLIAGGELNVATILTRMRDVLAAADAEIDYVAICSATTLAPLTHVDGPAVALIAARDRQDPADRQRTVERETLPTVQGKAPQVQGKDNRSMYQTLFTIPKQIAGIDVFGFGWVLGIWAVAAVVIMAISYRRHGWSAETRSQLGAVLIVGLAIAFLLPNLMDERLGGLAIRGYGAHAARGRGQRRVALTMYRAERVGVNPEICLSLGTWFFIWGIIGARAFYVIEYWERFQKATLSETVFAIVNLTQGGLVVYGSLLAGGVALIVFVRKYHLPGLALADLIAPGVVLGVGLGRLGCFLNGCCYGGLSELPWAVEFPPEAPAYIDQVEHGTVVSARHPL